MSERLFAEGGTWARGRTAAGHRLGTLAVLLLTAGSLLAMPLAARAATFTSLSAVPASSTESWSSTDVLIGLLSSAEEAVAGPLDVRYILDSGEAQSYVTTLTVSAEGVHTLQYWAVDAQGTSETTKTATVRIDKTVPQTISTVCGPYVRMLPLRLYPYDSLSGVATVEWNLDGGAWNVGTTVLLPAPGTYLLAFRATDNAGNVEPTKSLVISTDTTPPVTVSHAAASYTGSATIRLSATDAQSGIADTRWSINGGVTWYSGTSVSVPKPGSYTLRFRSADKAGNLEPVRTASVRVQKHSVVVTKSPAGPSYWLRRTNGVASWLCSAVFKTATGATVKGKSVQLQRSTDGVRWTTAYTLTTDATGKAVKKLAFTRHGATYWRWYSPTTGTYKSASSTRTRMVVY